MPRASRKREGYLGAGHGARLQIRLKPRAKNDRLTVLHGGLVDVAVTSPPIDDRANGHLIEFLSDRLGVPKRSISVIAGGHSRNKVVEVEGMTKKEAVKKLKVEREGG
jgi:uncharacterized protein (TIGR00251 family)